MIQVVVKTYGCVQFEVCDPRLVQKPCEGCIAAEDIVAGLLIFPGECVRIVLRIHSTDISCDSCLETEDLCKGVAVVESDAAAAVG